MLWRMIHYRLLLLKRSPLRWGVPMMGVIIITFMIALGIGGITEPKQFATLLWITIFLGTMPLIQEIFLLDPPEIRDQLIIAPISTTMELLGRGITLSLLLIPVVFLISGGYLLFLNLPLHWIWPRGIAVLFGGLTGYITLGMIIGMLTRNLRQGWLQLLLLPLLFPLFMVVIKGYIATCSGYFDPFWGGMLIGLDLIYIALFMVLPEVIREG